MKADRWTVRRRYRHIIGTLARHGVGYTLASMGFPGLIPFHRGFLGHKPQELPYTSPQHLRMALEELGPAFIKLGQILSTRSDLLPPEYITELSRLQAGVPAVPFSELAKVLEEELGPDFRNRFAALDEAPLAAASIGQVHRARLKSGQRVVVKVQRPSVREEIAVDLVILRRVFRRASRLPVAQLLDLEGVFEEFSITIERELDYEEEARHADRLRQNLADFPGVYVPKIFWELVTKRVLTMEEVSGARIDDIEAIDRMGVDRVALAERCARLYLKMVLEDGFFHADPHPGNFFIRQDGTVVLLDFGMVGFFSETNREQLLALIRALVRQDAEGMVDSILDLGAGLTPVERQVLTQDVHRLVARYADRPLGSISMELVIKDVFGIAYRHRLRLPSNLSLLAKTLMMSEGLARRLHPGFQVMDVLVPFVRHVVWQEYGPKGLKRRLPVLALEAADAMPRLPGTLYRLLRRAERGDLSLAMEAHQFSELSRTIDQAGRRVAGALTTGLFLIAMTLLLLGLPAGASPAVVWLVRGGFAAALGLVLRHVHSGWNRGRFRR